MTPPFPGARPIVLPEVQTRAGPVALISHPALPGVEVLPYVANSLVFAQMAAAAAAAVSRRSVMMDLPDRMSRHPGTLNLPLALLPLVSVVIYPAAAGRPRLGVPVSPASPPVMAALVARQRGLALRCIEPVLGVPAAAAFHALPALPEDYRVYRSGLAGHFAEAWPQLDACFAAANDEVRLFAALRAASASQGVRTGLGHQRLLVVEWRLWWLMSRLLDGAIADPSATVRLLPSPSRHERPVLYLPDPGEAWRCGLLDDYPALVAEFHERIAGATPTDVPGPAGNVLPLPLRMAWRRPDGMPACALAPAYDKREGLDRLLADVATSPDATAGSTSTRQLMAFVQYLPRLALGHAVPRTASHVLQAARACGGVVLASRLRRAILAYPRPPALPARTGVQAEPSLAELTTGWGTSLATGAAGDETEEARLRGAELLAAAAEQEGALQQLLGSPRGSTMFTAPPDYTLHESILRMAQRKAAGVCEATAHSRPVFASLEAGIDFQATLCSFASNPRGTVYVRHESSTAAPDVDSWTPVVFVLEPVEVVNRSTIMPVLDANPAMHRLLRGLDPGSGPRDHVFTVMTCVHQIRRRHDGHTRIDMLSAIGWLFASRLMGPDRHAQALARCHTPCRTDPDFEPEWKAWTRQERLLGWALKYGNRSSIIVVAGKGFDAGPRVRAYANARGLRILNSSLDSIPAPAIGRLRRMLLVSSNIKNHPSGDELIELLGSGLGQP